jgi:hypothetical protein
MTPDQWNDLLYALERRKCLLVLGAGVSTSIRQNKARPLTERLALQLALALRRQGRRLDPSESRSLLYTATEYLGPFNRQRLHQAVEQFYQDRQLYPAPALQAVTDLPVALIVTTAPDLLLEKAYRRLLRDYRSAHYRLNRSGNWEDEQAQLETPTVDCPLIYHLFGSIEQSDSLVLTELDRLKFIEDIIQHNNAIPNAILREFTSDKVVVFLGFEFEEWHLRVLPKALLRREENAMPVLATRGERPLTPGAMVFYRQQYRMEFLPYAADAFLTELSQRWLDHQARQPEAGATEAPAPLEVLYLYHQNDQAFKTELDKHLAVLRSRQYIRTWDESMVEPGLLPDAAIRTRLESANLILLLVSADFLADARLYEEQLRVALLRYRQGQTIICPVLVRPCVWEDALFARLPSILPRNKKTLAEWTDADAAYRHVAQQLESFVETLLENLQVGQP